MPPYPPMEAASVDEIPVGTNWQYEPKWDGFRCLAFRDGSTVELQSKSGQSLTRYFPEITTRLARLRVKKFVLDSELVIPAGKSLSFDDLLLRLHPAASRVEKLSLATPALMVAFDLLVDEKGKAVVGLPLKERRLLLEKFFKKIPDDSRLTLSPQTRQIDQARAWLSQSGSSLDGVMAKRLDLPYRSGERDGMVKIKRIRSIDCVVGGFRYGTGKKEVGSLLLGLYDQNGLLHHVGFTSGIKATDKPDLTRKLEALRIKPGFTGRAPGGPSRWATEKSGVWEPVAPRLVVEVRYDHFAGGRFRHGTRLLRWRPEKAPKQCTWDQLEPQRSGALKLLTT